MKYLTLGFFALACASLVSSPASADTITLSGLTSDAGLTANLQLDGGSAATTFRAGLTTSSGFGRAGIWVFQLPTDLSASDIVSVSFSVGLVSISSSPSFNADLYAITASLNNNVQGSYYYNGSAADTTSGVSLIQDNFATSSTAAGMLSTSTDGSTALKSFVSAQIAAGNGGKYIFLRVSPDIDTLLSQATGYNFATANNITEGITLPTLTIITSSSVPEPSTYAMILGLIASGWAACSRRARSIGHNS